MQASIVGATFGVSVKTHTSFALQRATTALTTAPCWAVAALDALSRVEYCALLLPRPRLDRVTPSKATCTSHTPCSTRKCPTPHATVVHQAAAGVAVAQAQEGRDRGREGGGGDGREMTRREGEKGGGERGRLTRQTAQHPRCYSPVVDLHHRPPPPGQAHHHCVHLMYLTYHATWPARSGSPCPIVPRAATAAEAQLTIT